VADFDEALGAFAVEVGSEGPVCVRGGGTRWNLGGDVAPGTREVAAPAGIVAFEPAEMTVRVRAGTPVADLHEALSAAGQRTSLPERPGGTVGGALMAGESSVARLGLGPVRDALLQARYVCADGRIASGGAGTVKNVSGFDLCRLLVGSLGTLGLVGEALLRTVPLGEAERWVRLPGADPDAARSCHTAASVLWDGTDVWALLSGYGVDVDEDLSSLAGLAAAPSEDVDGPPDLPPHRWSCTPSEAASFGSGNGTTGRFVAEIGVGVVHASEPQPAREAETGVAELNRRFKERFDPTGRLNPGRDPLRKP
jgi:glycolate oxidase FAD binding subunit